MMVYATYSEMIQKKDYIEQMDKPIIICESV